MRLLGRALHAEPFLAWPIALLIAMFTPMQKQGARARALSSGAGGPFRRAGVANAADGDGSAQAQRRPAARYRSPRQAALQARSRLLFPFAEMTPGVPAASQRSASHRAAPGPRMDDGARSPSARWRAGQLLAPAASQRSASHRAAPVPRMDDGEDSR